MTDTATTGRPVDRGDVRRPWVASKHEFRSDRLWKAACELVEHGQVRAGSPTNRWWSLDWHGDVLWAIALFGSLAVLGIKNQSESVAIAGAWIVASMLTLLWLVGRHQRRRHETGPRVIVDQQPAKRFPLAGETIPDSVDVVRVAASAEWHRRWLLEHSAGWLRVQPPAGHDATRGVDWLTKIVAVQATPDGLVVDAVNGQSYRCDDTTELVTLNRGDERAIERLTAAARDGWAQAQRWGLPPAWGLFRPFEMPEGTAKAAVWAQRVLTRRTGRYWSRWAAIGRLTLEALFVTWIALTLPFAAHDIGNLVLTVVAGVIVARTAVAARQTRRPRQDSRGRAEPPPHTNDAGLSVVEIPLVLGLLLLPVCLLVLTLPTWSERQTVARAAADEAARTMVLAADPDEGAAAAQEAVTSMARNWGLNPAQMTLTWSGTWGRGGTVTAHVTVTMPATVVPGIGEVGAWSFTASHSERVDDYRTIGVGT